MADVPVVSRAAWGARPWQGKEPYTVSIRERTEFFVHYHGAPPPAHFGNAVPRNVEKIHVDYRGWAGTGYNFMVDMAGAVFEGRGWNLVGAHSPKHNRQGLGVYVAVGGDHRPTEASLVTVRRLYDEACVRAGRTLAKKGHRDARATECPGDLLYGWVRGGMAVSTFLAAPTAIGDGSDSDRPVLAIDTAGRHVEALQEALSNAGYVIVIDGHFGVDTLGAVLAFQRDNGLKPDGVVGPATYAALSRTINEKEDSMKNLIVQYPGRSTQYLIVPGVSRKHIATTADVRAYEAAGAVRATLTGAEIDGYPDVR